MRSQSFHLKLPRTDASSRSMNKNQPRRIWLLVDDLIMQQSLLWLFWRLSFHGANFDDLDGIAMRIKQTDQFLPCWMDPQLFGHDWPSKDHQMFLYGACLFLTSLCFEKALSFTESATTKSPTNSINQWITQTILMEPPVTERPNALLRATPLNKDQKEAHKTKIGGLTYWT